MLLRMSFVHVRRGESIEEAMAKKHYGETYPEQTMYSVVADIVKPTCAEHGAQPTFYVCLFGPLPNRFVGLT